MKRLKGILLLFVYLCISFSIAAQDASLIPDGPMDEYSLNGRILTFVINTIPDSLKDSPPLQPTDFDLINEPPGLIIADVVFTTYTTCDITLGFLPYVDFDSDFPDFHVEIRPSALYASSGTYYSDMINITAVNEFPTANITPDIPLDEQNLDVRNLTLLLNMEWFWDVGLVDPTDFTPMNAPGVSISSVIPVDSNEVTLFLDYDGTDFDSVITDFQIAINHNELVQTSGSDLLSNTETITHYIENPQAYIIPDSILTEQRLDGRYIDLSLLDESFSLYSTLTPPDFSLIGAPPGTTIEFVNGIDPNNARIYLAFDGTDFDSDFLAFEIDIESAVLVQTPTGVLTTDSLQIFAYDEPTTPVIQNVSILAVPLKIGDIGVVTVTVDDDSGNSFNLVSGDIGGYTLGNLTRTNNTTYHAEFTVTEGGTDYLSADDIPVTNLVLDNLGSLSTQYSSAISQLGDPIDANRPSITMAAYASADTLVGSGEKVFINLAVSPSEVGLLLSNSTTINSVPGSSPFVTLADIGGGNYTLTYLVQLGDPDAATGIMPVNIILEDAVGNASIGATSYMNNIFSVNANTPFAEMVADSVLEEGRLDVRALDIGIRNDFFIDTGSLSLANFSIAEGPVGLSLEDVHFFDTDSMRFEVFFDNTDFDFDTVLVISIDNTTMANATSDVLTTPLPVYAIQDFGPMITDVQIPDTVAGIGATVPVGITVENDSGNVYILTDGSIGGYAVTNLARVDSTNYSAQILVVEGGNSYTEDDSIPIVNMHMMDGPTPGNFYNGYIVQTGDLIDALRPVLTQATLQDPDTLLVAGDTLKIILYADSSTYELSDLSTINGIQAPSPTISYADNGDDSYTISYAIGFGDPDVPPSSLGVSLVLKDAAQNISFAFNSLDANNLEIVAATAHLNILEDSVLIEHMLDQRVIMAKLLNERFIDHTTLVPGDFTLINAPAGLTIDQVNDKAADSVSLHLAFDGTDFSTPVPDLKLSISSTVLINSTVNLLSDNQLLVNPSADPPLTINYTKTDISKAGAADGSIDLTVSGGIPPYSYSWSNGAFMEDLTMLAAGIYTVNVSDSDTAVASESIEILGLADSCSINVDFTYVVAGNTVTFTNLSDADKYNWQLGDGRVSDLTAPSHTYDFPGLYEVCLVGINSSGDCMVEKCIKIEVGTINCSAEFGFIHDSIIPNKLHLINSTQGAADTWYWNFGDGITSTLSDPVHEFDKPGSYTVCLNTLDNATGCQSEYCLEVLVGALDIKADFTYFVDPAARKATFSDHSTGDITSWYWTFGDGNIHLGKDTVHQYARDGNYAVCLIVWNEATDARDEICHEIQVGSPSCDLVADFSFFVDASARKISMTDLSMGKPDLWFWDFGDGTTSSSQNPTHMYADSGNYLVSVSVRDNTGDCFDFHSELIQVGGIECRADFDFMVDPESNTVHFKERSKGSIAEYFWFLDDGAYSSDTAFAHSYNEAGRYNVSLTVVDQSGKCMDYIQREIQVGTIECKAGFTYFIDSASNEVYFRSEIMGTVTDLLWTFGDGFITEEQNPVHRFPAPGYYSVSLNTFNGVNRCMDFHEEIILIGSQGLDCKADFIYQSDMQNKTVNFTAKPLGDIVSYTWNFGDTVTSVLKDPEHTYSESGNYWVCLTVINSAGYSDIFCKQIQIAATEDESCLADFMYTVDSLSKKVNFKNNSFGNPDTWYWDFDDNVSSTEKDPFHTYADTGYYTVILEISNSSSGCSHSTMRLINVGKGYEGIRADFVYDTSRASKKADTYPVDFIGVSLGDGSKLKWTFGDGTADSTSLNPTHVYKLESSHEAFNACFEVSNQITRDAFKECQTINLSSTGISPVVFGKGIMLENRPNPFENSTNIVYRLPSGMHARMSIYDLSGREIEQLFNKWTEGGTHRYEFLRGELSGGVYILRLETPVGYRTSKLILK